MPRTAPGPNAIAIPGMNPGTVLQGGGGDGGGGSGKGGGGSGGKKGAGTGDGQEDAEAGGNDGQGGDGCGDPICPVTGKMFLDVFDFGFWAPKQLRFIRHYNSRTSDAPGDLGYGWTHPFGWRLLERRRVVLVFDDRSNRQKFPRPKLNGPPVRNPFGWLLFRRADGFYLSKPDGDTLVFRPSPDPKLHFLVAITDLRNNRLSIDRDEGGGIVGFMDGSGRPYCVRRDTVGRITKIQVPLDEAQQNWLDLSSYDYDANGDLARYTDAAGYVWHYRYENHLMVEHQTACGLSYCYRYDGRTKHAYCVESWGEYIGRQDPALEQPLPPRPMNGGPDTRPVKGINSVKLTFDKEGYYSEVENGIGGVERYFGDAFGRVIKHVSAAGAVTERSFDAASGQVTERTDSSNHRHTILKDVLGAPMGFERPDGSGTKVRIKEPYTVERVATDTGAVVEIRHNEYGEIVHYRHPDGTFEAMEYDERGLLALYVDRAGGTTRYVRDAMGNPIEVQHPHGGSEHIRYDFLGRPIEYRSPAGELTQWAYDARSEIVFKRLHDGTEIHIERDANRKPVTIRLGQRVRRFEYGGLGWVTRIIEPDGAATEYRYDVEGNLTLVRNPRGQVFRCQFDQARRLIACKSFEGIERSGSYDVSGLLTSLTRPLGADARTYDHEQRLIAADTPDGSVTLEYLPSGGVKKIDNGIAALEHGYNSMRELVKDQQADHASELEWGSGWLRSVTSDVGVPVRYAYAGGSLSRIDAGRLALHLHYPNPDDILVYLGDGLVHRRHHDKLGFLRWAVWSRYDERQGKTDDEVALPNGPDQLLMLQYDYNDQGELIREQRSDGRVVAYEHDACGRIVEKRVWRNRQLISEETPRYDAAGSPLLSDVQHDALMRPTRYANETFEYDDAGRLVRRLTDAGEWEYEWDFDDNLLKVVAPHHTVEMDYDGRGRRMRKRVLVDGSVVRRASYVWSNQTLLHEVDETAGVTRTYLRHNADWVAFGHVDKAGDTETACFYLADGSGMPDLAFDGQGNVVWSAERSVFGVIEADPASRVDVRVRFANQLYDADVGLVYNRMRWYDPRTGSYVSPDPILLRGGLNHRDYVSNPTLYIDPMGHAPTPTNNKPFGKPPSGHTRPPHPGNADGMTPEYMRNPGHFATEGTKKTPGYVSIDDPALLNAAGSGLDPVRDRIDAAGAAYGCHTCGSKNPRGPDYPQEGDELKKDRANTHFVPDHIPPSTLHTPRRGDALIEDIPAGGVRLYPQCRRCSSTQGGQLGALTRSSTSDERAALGQAGIDRNVGQ